ncbi:MAG TPA: hypothetical protein VKZ84_07210 [Bacteriovoracaceae bacterium]|nr:hypothetical protein [Bacteriovoracaceae bacterium]
MQLKIKRRINAYSHIFQKKILEEIKKITEGPKIVIKEKKEHEQDYDDLALTLNKDPQPKRTLH